MKFLWLVLVGAVFSFGAVDINKADKKELMSVPGVGKAKADAILEYRKAHKCFSSVDELKKIKGLGGKFVEKNKGAISASECKK